ncbi:MAG: ribosome small subunit-dependent GTPase A [Clostridiales Family XIII bacterium]|nr:ribosome small subunit-dependent GTPase A [Clostridiales Family XIII bacterium]
MIGTIVKALSGFYYVRIRERESSASRVYRCRARGVLKKDGISPLVGDEAEIDILDDDDGVVTAILPRRNSFVRPAVANIDLFVATVAAHDPEPHLETLDRFLAVAEAASADAIVCVNKIDLGSADFLVGVYDGIYDTLPVSAGTGEGMDALKAALAAKRSAFAGPSGVGKSSIINFLLRDGVIETGGVSRKTGRGRHTTRHVEIFRTDFGAELFDTPGYTSFDGATVEPEEVGSLFPEIARLSAGCRFDDCMHLFEPNCAVRDAASEGNITGSRYSSYLRMLDEAIVDRRKGTSN